MISVGLLLIVAALLLIIHNYKENRDAEDAASLRLELLREAIAERSEMNSQSENSHNVELMGGNTFGTIDEMAVVNLNGEEYIGYLTIPEANLELPVTAHWSEANLKKAICRHYGSIDEKNLVIAGHNYSSGFGKLRNLKISDQVYFTDMNGKTHKYIVEEIEILNADDIKKMIESDWELSLYTCTYNGKQRVTVRCKEAE